MDKYMDESSITRLQEILLADCLAEEGTDPDTRKVAHYLCDTLPEKSIINAVILARLARLGGKHDAQA